MKILSWRYNKFILACKPPARLELRDRREIHSGHQVELGKNVGDNILLSGQHGLIQFRDELVAEDALVFLLEPGCEAKIELAPGNRLCREIRDAGGNVRTIIFRQRGKGLSQRVHVLNGCLQRGELVGGNVDGNLDAGLPAPFLHVEHARLCGGTVVNWFRAKEERDAIRCSIRRSIKSHDWVL